MSRARWLVPGLVAAWLMVWPGPVGAHPELVEANPAPGATLASPPAEMRLTFSEPLGEGSTFRLFGTGFEEVPGVAGQVDPADPHQMAGRVSGLTPGDYTVQWTAVGDDGHEVRGSYGFSLRGEGLLSSSTLRFGLLALAGFGLGFVLSRVARRRRA